MAESVIDLCDSDDDGSPLRQIPPARQRRSFASRYNATINDNNRTPASRRRKRSATELIDLDAPKAARLKKTGDSDDDDDIVQVVKTTAAAVLPPSALQQVLELFPDIQTAHAQKLLRENKNIAANVIDALLQAGNSYPKEQRNNKNDSRARTSASTMTSPGGGILIRKNRAETDSKYNFMSTSSFEPSAGYKTQSTSQLVYDFPFLTKTGARVLLAACQFHYAVTHDKITRAVTGSDDGKKVACASRGTGDESSDIEVQQYRRYKAVTEGNLVTMDDAQFTRLTKVFGIPHLKRKGNLSTIPNATRKRLSSNTVFDDILLEEIGFVQRKIRAWTDEIETTMQRCTARKIAIIEGSALDCPCCYDQVAPDELVACKNAHMFCVDCLSNYANNKVFSDGSFGVHPDTKAQALELLCFHTDGCDVGFDRAMLQKALAPKILERYDELQSQLSLEQAGLRDTICTCPKCGYSAVLPDEQNVFACPVEDCRFESCRKCREASHVPLRCDEVEKKQEADGRARVEEAASNAIIRFCPKCKKGIIKSDGCNKMTCPSCKNVKFCYMCREVVRDYSHFCQTPHCTHTKCKKCPLWTKDLDAIHAKEVRDAAVSEAARVEAESAKFAPEEKKAAAMFDDGDKKPAAVPKSVHVDVDRILQAP